MKLTLSIYAAALCGQLAVAGPSIIGGELASPGSAPYMVSIQKNDIHLCGGTLIRDNLVLTAAHCLVHEHPRSLRIAAGSHSYHKRAVTRGVAKGIIHADHDGKKRINDVALIRLRRPFKLTDTVRTVELSQRQQIDGGTNVTVYGWGYTSYPHQKRIPKLQVLHRNIVDTAACNDAYVEYNGKNVTDNQLCTQTQGQGTCWGDSGGPLVWIDDDGKEYQVGIVSWGVSCAREWPDIATKVSSYLKWIEDNSA
ncbi:hypothetical protein MY5147_003637 [Beauveria neobassiana]